MDGWVDEHWVSASTERFRGSWEVWSTPRTPEKLEFPARLSALRQKKCGNYKKKIKKKN